MISNNFTKIGGIGALGILFLGSLVYAQNAPLSATCSGTPNRNVITWAVAPAGGNQPYSFQWSGTNVTGTAQTVTATYNATGTYSATVAVRDTATSTASSSAVNANCSATVTALPVPIIIPPPTTVPVHRLVSFKEPKLEINASGKFLARGMFVQSVASTSFTAKVWGITWTIDTSGLPELFLKEGKGIRFGMDQIHPGDEVSVEGRVNADTPLVVKARVVRNWSLVVERIKPAKSGDDDDNDDDKDKDKEKKDRNTTSSAEIQSIRDQIKVILEQIKNLQDRVRGR